MATDTTATATASTTSNATATAAAASTATEDEDVISVKCVWVGDRKVGKTSLLLLHKEGTFPEEDEFFPALYPYEDEEEKFTIDGQPVTARFLEVLGSEDYHNTRPLNYYHADVVAVCFSVACRPSFESVTDMYLPELKRHVPDTPVILLGTKTDLRRDTETQSRDRLLTHSARAAAKKKLKNECVSAKQGRKLALTLKAHAYLEFSSLAAGSEGGTGKKGEGVEEEAVRAVVEEVVRVAVREKKAKMAASGFRCVLIKPLCAVV
ncbi:rho-related protein rac1B-like isoform X1 [Babylonia areolata]|uniref:rho-related protein rac1B-like isoform X1 n=1 Tax=Babylonia areolata TaxID=304850 RepID=UPI003FD33537